MPIKLHHPDGSQTDIAYFGDDNHTLPNMIALLEQWLHITGSRLEGGPYKVAVTYTAGSDVEAIFTTVMTKIMAEKGIVVTLKKIPDGL